MEVEEALAGIGPRKAGGVRSEERLLVTDEVQDQRCRRRRVVHPGEGGIQSPDETDVGLTRSTCASPSAAPTTADRLELPVQGTAWSTRHAGGVAARATCPTHSSPSALPRGRGGQAGGDPRAQPRTASSRPARPSSRGCLPRTSWCGESSRRLWALGRDTGSETDRPRKRPGLVSRKRDTGKRRCAHV